MEVAHSFPLLFFLFVFLFNLFQVIIATIILTSSNMFFVIHKHKLTLVEPSLLRVIHSDAMSPGRVARRSLQLVFKLRNALEIGILLRRPGYGGIIMPQSWRQGLLGISMATQDVYFEVNIVFLLYYIIDGLDLFLNNLPFIIKLVETLFKLFNFVLYKLDFYKQLGLEVFVILYRGE